jgi:hypothetical protein
VLPLEKRPESNTNAKRNLPKNVPKHLLVRELRKPRLVKKLSKPVNVLSKRPADNKKLLKKHV